MVCPRCVLAVKRLLEDLRIPHKNVILGEFTIDTSIDDLAFGSLNKGLQDLGFEILEDENQQLVEEIKLHMRSMTNQLPIDDSLLLSENLANTFLKDYSAISKLFSQVEGVTIEHFFIDLKIEKIKELLTYENDSISEISEKMGYKNTSHFSGQFKKETGLSPTAFRQLFSKISKIV